MTNNINPQNHINFGGVRVNQNEIASKKVVKENGATRFIINFKNGTTIKYPAQAKKNEASVKASFDSKLDNADTQVYHLAYGKITGNPQKHDTIWMSGCKSCEVDVANDNNDDYVSLESTERYEDPSLFSQIMGETGPVVITTHSKNNNIKMGKEDVTRYEDTCVTGEGVHIEGQE